MLVCVIFIVIVAFSVVIIFTDFISADNLYIIFFVIEFSVLSMLLVFSVVEEIFSPKIKATALAIVNMVIGPLCGAIFQYLISYISVYLNGGPLTGEINIDVFDRAFIYLIIPLLLSTIIIFTTVVEKYRTREISLIV